MATPIHTGKEETKPTEPAKTRAGRKTGAKIPNQKKPPQRGLGVAQLERLRLQEKWKTTTEMPPHHHFFQSHSPHLLDNTFVEFPLQFPAAAPAMVVTDCGAGVLGFNHQGLVVQRIGNNGGFLAGGEPYPHGGGVLIGNSSVEASRELSSIPKLLPPPFPSCGSDRCDTCFKKKRVNFSNIMKEKNVNVTAAEAPPPLAAPASFDFLGLSTNPTAELNSPTVVNHHTNPNFDFDFSFNFNQGRGGVGGGGGGGDGDGDGSRLMEYEFFPRKNGRGTEIEELKMPKEELSLFGEENEDEEEEILAVDHGEGSCITTSCNDIINGGTRNSTALDLSLKLSF